MSRLAAPFSFPRAFVAGFGLLAFANPLQAFAAQKRAPEKDVEQAIAQRTGQQMEWIRSQEQEEKLQSRVAKILQRPLTATSAAQIALLNNKELQATLAEVGISQADLIEAGLLSNPSFDGMARVPNMGGVTNLEAGLAQDFLDLLVLPLRKRVAAAELEATKLRVAAEVLKLIAETKEALYTVQADQLLLDRFKVLVGTNEATVDLAQRRHDAGNIPDVDLVNEQATYSQSRLEVAKASLELAVDREKLNRFLGLFGDQTRWTTARSLPPLPRNEVSWDGLETLAVQQRFDLAAAQTNLSILLTSLKLTRTYRYLGVLELGVSSERDTDRNVVTGPTVRLTLPIFNWGQGRIAKIQAQLAQAESQFAAMAVNIRSEVREANARVHGQREVTEFHRDVLLPERVRSVNFTQLQYNAMQIGAADLLVVKQRELEAERGYAEAWRDYWIARASLERAVGGSLSQRVRQTESFKEVKN